MKLKTPAAYFSILASIVIIIVVFEPHWQSDSESNPTLKTVSLTQPSSQLDQLLSTNPVIQQQQSSTNKTNIIFVLADDMGVWAAGTYGNPEIHTPNIDRLAREGLKFMNTFSNTPVCSASRASILTGKAHC